MDHKPETQNPLFWQMSLDVSRNLASAVEFEIFFCPLCEMKKRKHLKFYRWYMVVCIYIYTVYMHIYYSGSYDFVFTLENYGETSSHL